VESENNSSGTEDLVAIIIPIFARVKFVLLVLRQQGETDKGFWAEE
jgi:hypothetical protein